MIRDDTLIPNVIWFEYTNSRGEAQKRLRKLNKNKSKWNKAKTLSEVVLEWPRNFFWKNVDLQKSKKVWRDAKLTAIGDS